MATLNETNGPSNALAGVMPALVEDRDGRRHWIVYEAACNMWAVHTSSPDLARALVLDRLGYGSRPELAEGLDARPASQAEITAVCHRKRVQPLKVTPKNASRIGKLARLLDLEDRRHGIERQEGRAASRQAEAGATRRASVSPGSHFVSEGRSTGARRRS